MRFKMRLLFEEEMKKKLDRVQYCPEFKKLKEICNRHRIGLDVVIDSSMHVLLRLTILLGVLLEMRRRIKTIIKIKQKLP